MRGMSVMNRWIRAALAAVVVSFGLGWAALAHAAGSVNVVVEVFEASRSGAFDGPAKRYASNFGQLGYKSAKLVDTVRSSGQAEGSSRQLQFTDPSGKKQKMSVKVLEAGKSTVRLEVDVPGYKFKIKTTHNKGGAYIVKVSNKDILFAIHP